MAQGLTRVPVREQNPKVRATNFEEVCYGYNKEEAVEEAKRCLGCKKPKCVEGCPVSINIPEFIAAVKEENFEEAFKIISQSSALPAVCGRVCPQESQCEGKCIRGIKGEPVAIGKLERFVADWARENGIKPQAPAEKNGKKVAVISSGDAGIYGMAGLILELITKQELDIPVKVVPGVTASIGAAAVLGAPIMHDFCHISLSDLMTPWEVIEKRLRLAAEADFVICLYNPRSKGRSEHLANAFKIMGEFKDGSTPVGIVKDVGREDQEKFICTFDTMDFERVDMTTMVIIGNKSTYIHDDLMITPRGYTV